MLPISAKAVNYGQIGAKPLSPNPDIENSSSWFIYNLEPGQSKQDVVVVSNSSAESLNLLIYAADTTHSSNGGFALKQFSEPKTNVGSWVRFYPKPVPDQFLDLFKTYEGSIIDFCNQVELTSLEYNKTSTPLSFSDEDKNLFNDWCKGEESVNQTFSPETSAEIPFIFRVPENVDVGEHSGGILVQKQFPEKTPEGKSGVRLTTRIGVRIYQTVPGEIEKKLTLENFSVEKNFQEFDYSRWFQKNVKPEEYIIQTSISNEGNVSVEYTNTVTIRNAWDGFEETKQQTFSVLRNDVFSTNLIWNNPRFGKFIFTPKITYTNTSGESQTLTSNAVVVYIFPWRESIVIFTLLLLFGIAWNVWTKLQKRKYSNTEWVPYVIDENDTITRLAEKSGKDWKILAKVNNIKPPYLLPVGETILIPPQTTDNTTSNTLDQKNISQISHSPLQKSAKTKTLSTSKNTHTNIFQESSPLTLGSKKVTSERFKIIKENFFKKYLFLILGTIFVSILISALITSIIITTLLLPRVSEEVSPSKSFTAKEPKKERV
jgi:hypothetical protein